jgi:hypothetical protein
MPRCHCPDQFCCCRLRERIALALAFEQATMEHLAQGAADLRANGQEAAAAEIEVLIRRHRVSILKHRAILSAHGIEA